MRGCGADGAPPRAQGPETISNACRNNGFAGVESRRFGIAGGPVSGFETKPQNRHRFRLSHILSVVNQAEPKAGSAWHFPQIPR